MKELHFSESGASERSAQSEEISPDTRASICNQKLDSNSDLISALRQVENQRYFSHCFFHEIQWNKQHFDDKMIFASWFINLQ